MIAVVYKNESAVLYVFFEKGAFLRIKLYQLMAAQVAEGRAEQLIAAKVNYFFLRMYGNGSVFYEGV